MKKKLKKKIKKLFKYRKIPFLLSYLPKEDRRWLRSKLFKLQAAIYDLDLYLESNWQLDSDSLDKYWQGMFQCLEVLDIRGNEAKELTKHIRKYQLHETQLRKGILPTRLTREYYYYYKSCDVRLMRNIIALYSEECAQEISLSDWRYFDLITEIDDDVEDIFEDQITINGNLFNILIHEQGLKKTVKEFKNLLTDFEEKSQIRTEKSKNNKQKKIHKWTVQYTQATKKLLKINRKKIKKMGLKSNQGLFSYLKD